MRDTPNSQTAFKSRYKALQAILEPSSRKGCAVASVARHRAILRFQKAFRVQGQQGKQAEKNNAFSILIASYARPHTETKDYP